MSQSIKIAESDSEIKSCFEVMLQLRPKVKHENFVKQVRELQSEGYLLAFLEDKGEVAAVAGFRLTSCLAIGRFMYVDDLVTNEATRGKGFGSALFDWLVAYARKHECKAIQLDSGTQRFGAHRFYLLKGMDITCHHFTMMLD